LPVVTILILLNWTLDSIDGPLARRQKDAVVTWIGKHDLEIDLLITTAVLIYLTAAGTLSWPVTMVYLLIWAVIFWLKGILAILGVLYQLPIYIWFIITVFLEMPLLLLLMIAWPLLGMIVSWPKVPDVIVPELISGVTELFNKRRQSS
jgi:phosphatidylglycerophosphate synthase